MFWVSYYWPYKSYTYKFEPFPLIGKSVIAGFYDVMIKRINCDTHEQSGIDLFAYSLSNLNYRYLTHYISGHANLITYLSDLLLTFFDFLKTFGRDRLLLFTEGKSGTVRWNFVLYPLSHGDARLACRYSDF